MDEPGSYFYVLAMQWVNTSGPGMIAQTFTGEIRPGAGSTRRSLTKRIIDNHREQFGIVEELPLILFFSLEPNKLPR